MYSVSRADFITRLSLEITARIRKERKSLLHVLQQQKTQRYKVLAYMTIIIYKEMKKSSPNVSRRIFLSSKYQTLQC